MFEDEDEDCEDDLIEDELFAPLWYSV